VLPGRFEFFVSGSEDGGVACGEAVGWGDVAERRVEAHSVVMVDEATDDAFGVLQGKRGFRPDGVFFENAVEALKLAVALGMVRQAEDAGGLPEADELFEVLCHKLVAVVGDDARAGVRRGLAGPLDDDLGVGASRICRRGCPRAGMAREAPSSPAQR
jgi:hypothetical protein